MSTNNTIVAKTMYDFMQPWFDATPEQRRAMKRQSMQQDLDFCATENSTNKIYFNMTPFRNNHIYSCLSCNGDGTMYYIPSPEYGDDIPYSQTMVIEYIDIGGTKDLEWIDFPVTTI